MKRMLGRTPSVLLIFIVVIIAVDCNRSGNLSDAERATISKEVEHVLTAMSDSLHTIGLTGWVPFLLRSPDFSWEFHGVHQSYDSLVSGIKREAPQYRSITLGWNEVKVEPISTNEATVSTQYVETIVDTSGNKSTITGSVTSRLVKETGSWKFQSGKTIVEGGTLNQ